MYKKIFLGLILTTCYLLLTAPAVAATMTGGQYNVEINSSQEVPTPQPTASQQQDPQPGVMYGDGFTIRQGFPYVFGVNDFALAISSLLIDFGPLSPTNPILRTNMVSIDTGNAYGYELSAVENHELELKNGTTIVIPNTTCDDGLCSEDFDSSWVNTLTFGFGYRCDNLAGTDCIFTKPNQFRQFANEDEKKTAYPLLSGTNTGATKKAQITYKLNIPTTQARGLYSNVITFVALPGY